MLVYSHSYWLVIFCTTHSSRVLARERWQTFQNFWKKTQYLINTLYPGSHLYCTFRCRASQYPTSSLTLSFLSSVGHTCRMVCKASLWRSTSSLTQSVSPSFGLPTFSTFQNMTLIDLLADYHGLILLFLCFWKNTGYRVAPKIVFFSFSHDFFRPAEVDNCEIGRRTVMIFLLIKN